jgi:hypothetical protein
MRENVKFNLTDIPKTPILPNSQPNSPELGGELGRLKAL